MQWIVTKIAYLSGNILSPAPISEVSALPSWLRQAISRQGHTPVPICTYRGMIEILQIFNLNPNNNNRNLALVCLKLKEQN